MHELDELVLSYSPDPTQPLLIDADQAALPVAAFELVVDNIVDTAPVLEGLTVDGETLTLTFDQPLAGALTGRRIWRNSMTGRLLIRPFPSTHTGWC